MKVPQHYFQGSKENYQVVITILFLGISEIHIVITKHTKKYICICEIRKWSWVCWIMCNFTSNSGKAKSMIAFKWLIDQYFMKKNWLKDNKMRKWSWREHSTIAIGLIIVSPYYNILIFWLNKMNPSEMFYFQPRHSW